MKPMSQSRDFLERIIPEVRSGGARNIVELAKSLRMPVETTRYKVKGIIKRGLSVNASVDYNKFGLTTFYTKFHLTQRAKENEKRFFQVLADSCFLTSFARRVTTNESVCTFAIPNPKGAATSPIHRFLRGLSEERLIESPKIFGVTWKKSHMVQPEFFDLKKGIWHVDWARLRKEASSQSRGEEKETTVGDFDDLDLMIARELEGDALTRLSDIAESLKTTLNNVFYHFHKHIIEGKLVDEFVIRWNGTPKQETMFVQFEFENPSYIEEKSIRAAIRKIPYLWSDASSRDTGYYVAELMVPSTHYLETLNFLSGTLGDTARKMKVILLDAKTRQQLPLPAHLFKDSSWVFDIDSSLELVNSKLRK
jgi:DNA-binding Lrp family transcriptional regulator